MSPVLGLVALVLAQVGLIAWLRRRAAVPAAVAPALAAALSLLITYACGLAGRLSDAPWAVLVAGGLGLLWELIRSPIDLAKTLVHPAVLSLAVAMGALSWLLRGRLFQHYDNFSHWALVVRVMLRDARLPDATDPLVTFHSYPLGTASWEYAVARLTGPDEWHLMLAQDYLLAACAVSLLAVTPRRWWLGLPVAAGFGWTLATHGPALDTLLVDSVLAGWTIAGLALLAAHRGQVGRATLPLAALVAALVATKQTGVYWALVVILAACLLRTGRWWQRLAVLVVPTAVGAATLMAWQRHTALVYGAEPATKHAISVSRFRDVLAAKTEQERASIGSAYLHAVATNRQTWLVLAVLVLSLLLFMLARPGRGRRAAAAGAGVLGVTLVYLGGLYAMYLLSMPTGEALALAGFTRYLSTLTLVLLGVVVLVGLHIAEHAGWTWAPAALVLSLAGCAVLIPRGPLLDPVPADDVRVRVAAAFGQLTLKPDASVCVFSDVRDGGYRTALVRYLLLDEHVATLRAPDRARATLPVPCDYAAVVDPYPAGDAYLRLRGHVLTPGRPVVVAR